MPLLATMDDIEKLQAILSPALLEESFEALWKRVEIAANIKMLADVAVQLYASWIVYRALWDSVSYSTYVDIVTGDEYESEEDAPPDVNLRYINFERRWKSETEFLGWMSRKIPTGTFWFRHAQVVKELRMLQLATGREDVSREEFVQVVEGVVMANSIGATIAKSALTWTNTPSKPAVITGINLAVAERLVDELPEDEEERIRVVTEAAIEQIDEYRGRIRDGESRYRVMDDIRNRVLNRPSVSVRRSPDGEFKIKFHQPDYNASGELDIQINHTFVMRFVDESGNLLAAEDLPESLVIWMRKKLKVKDI